MEIDSRRSASPSPAPASAMDSGDLSLNLPRILIVSRRTVRKNKFVDFVGEYHLDLIERYGAVPVIVPRVAGLHTLLESFEPIHGVLLCEGEDIDPSHYLSGDGGLSAEDLKEIRRIHASDAAEIDREKDSIELRLARICLEERGIPCLGICRGSQILNVACGVTLYQEVEKKIGGGAGAVAHIDYGNYDGHRHPVAAVAGTPMHRWFRDPATEVGGGGGGEMEISVNSYHHQGVKRLAERFVPMAVAGDGLVEWFYDPGAYCPGEGKFVVGLQFHPERMRRRDSDEFDYPGCPMAYEEFVRAAVAYQNKMSISSDPKSVSIDVGFLESCSKRCG